jgi:hypothetical protein
MSTTKKRASAASSDSPKKSASSKKKDGDYRNSYVRLRTLLDAMEIGALRYYMDGETATEKNRRAEELESLIMPVINQYKQGLAEECPRGLNNCGGCCVPYRCPRVE